MLTQVKVRANKYENKLHNCIHTEFTLNDKMFWKQFLQQKKLNPVKEAVPVNAFKPQF